MINIAFVIDTIISPAGGTEKQLLALIKNLDKSKYNPILCVLNSSQWLRSDFDLCHLFVANIPSLKNRKTPFNLMRLAHFLKKQKVDIVHAFFKDGSRVGIMAGKLAGVQRVIAARRNQGYWMQGGDLRVTKFLNRWVDLMIANAHSTKKWTVETEGFPSDKIEVIHNGVDFKVFDSLSCDSRMQVREALNLPKCAPVVGIVANLRPVKDIGLFLYAAQQVRSNISDAHFVIVGEGRLEMELKKLACQLQLNDCVHFLGRRQDIPEILSGLDVGVLSSKSESFSNTITEYLAAGLPVVCTDVGGAREAVEDGVNGFVVQPGDAQTMAAKIIAILSNELSCSMRKASQMKAPLFSLDNMVEKHQIIYSRVAPTNTLPFAEGRVEDEAEAEDVEGGDFIPRGCDKAP